MKYLLIILLFICQGLKAQDVIILDENRKVILKEKNGNPNQDRIHFKERDKEKVFDFSQSRVYYVIRKENGKLTECKYIKQKELL